LHWWQKNRPFAATTDFIVLFALMLQYHETQIANESLWLLPDRALFWPRQKMLIVADAHLGKAAHFRKNGIALPVDLVLQDLTRLQKLIDIFHPKQLLFLGDLFHSAPNQEWNWFAEWLATNPTLEAILVSGNHDTHVPDHSINTKLLVVQELLSPPFLFTHEPQKTSPEGLYNLCGHIHPGVRLVGKGSQSLRLPCFWFGEEAGILPAFGNLTGHVRQKGKAQVFAIADQRILPL
jgi:DNA ligase-associated metallophosphoesterase